ncbi:aspartyl protease family protein [Cupriavidus basilensis]|uniref:aspartyl protease family protein n=1 Tax=Cupriavidus basilensis TaxID=68895 RepID=UPI0020C5DDD2|nr:aspartyl protease family protein [Cupriavidus basilensis]
MSPFVGNPPRPYADVTLNPSRLGVPTHKCLVDTGADYLLLPGSAAAASGLSLARSVTLVVSTVGGGVSMQLLTAVAVKIEGYRINVDVLFDPTNKCPPLAGRGVLLPAFAIGMQSSDWHWT